MAKACRYITTVCTDPYENLALEEFLLTSLQPGEVILYLWQNHHTVVIGRNQNAWREVRVPALQASGGHLVRRLSGGGAVYHDLGNLNFTFLAGEADYDVSRQTEVILRAVRSFGIPAERTGRNDITAQGRKFSGNAFYKTGGNAYHHGTLLVKVDMDSLSRYLNVPAQKLSSKGVDSVRARVVNLSDLEADVTIPGLAKALISAFGEVYGLTPQELPSSRLDAARIAELRQKFASWDWIYGRPIPFTWEGEARFPWGGMELKLNVRDGCVAECAAYSDAMEGDLVSRLPGLLTGRPFSGPALAQAIAPLEKESEALYQDLKNFLLSQNF